jgi:hypothetical protein
MENQIKFTHITSVDGVFMTEVTNDVQIVCNDSTGKNHVLVIHPSLVFSIHQFMIDAIVGFQEDSE